MEYAWKMPYPYKFLHILQTTPTIILKFLVSNFLSILVKKIKKKMKILLFLNSTGHIYLKIFTVSVSLFVLLVDIRMLIYVYT